MVKRLDKKIEKNKPQSFSCSNKLMLDFKICCAENFTTPSNEIRNFIRRFLKSKKRDENT